MTSKTCSAKILPVSNFFKFTLKKQTPLTLLATAFALLICDGILFKQIYDAGNSKAYYNFDFAVVFPIFAAGAFAISVLLMFLLLLNNFDFLFSKKAGDLFHSLPFTRNELLSTRAVSAFIGAWFTLTVTYSGAFLANCMPNVQPVQIGLIIKTYLLMTFFLAVLTAFTLIFVISCGGRFDVFIALAAVNVGIPAFLAVLMMFGEENSVGVSAQYDAIIYTSPFIYVAYKLACFMEYYDVSAKLNIQKVTVFSIICFLFFALVCVFICVCLFKKRKSETAGSAYSFRFMPNIIMLLVSACGGYLVSVIMSGNVSGFTTVEFWFFFIIGALLCAVTFGAVSDRGFKTIKKSLIKGGISIAVTVALICTTSVIYAKSEKYVPKVENISEIQFYNYDTIVFEDNFEVVTDLHKKLIEQGDADYSERNNSRFIYNINGLDITYILKNGKSVKRNYGYYPSSYSAEMYQNFLNLMQTKEFINYYYNTVSASKSGFLTLDLSIYDKEHYDDDGNLVIKSVSLTTAQAMKVVDNFAEELKNATVSVFYEDCVSVDMYADDYITLEVPISFTKTIDYINLLIEEYSDIDVE